jgi:hypothetical protein
MQLQPQAANIENSIVYLNTDSINDFDFDFDFIVTHKRSMS